MIVETRLQCEGMQGKGSEEGVGEGQFSGM